MNVKVILAGGLAMYVTQFIISMGTGPLIHTGVLTEAYQAHAGFWRPELNEVPPDMAALLPLWVSVGIIGSLVLAGIYTIVRPAYAGSGLARGAKYGLTIWLVQLVTMAGWSGVFNLPYEIWGWWAFEGALYMVAGGIALGIVAAKLDPHAD